MTVTTPTPNIGTFAGHRSREQCRLVAPRSVSRRITPTGGVAIHYGGGPTRITADTPHARCEEVWRAWQRYHMHGHGWADIAYTLGACQHGYTLAGRGTGVRTAANGTDAGNQAYYAIVAVIGDGDNPTPDLLAAIVQGIVSLRDAGAGARVRPHSDFRSTSCAGRELLPHIRSWDRAVLASPPRAGQVPTRRVWTGVPDLLDEDGDLGPLTRGAVEWYLDRAQDRSWDRMDVRAVQTWAGTERTGQFGPVDCGRVAEKVGARPTTVWTPNLTLGLQRFINRRIRDHHANNPTSEA